MDDYDSYDYQDVPDAPAVDYGNYDSYDYQGSTDLYSYGSGGAEDIMEGLGATGVDISSWWGGDAAAGTPSSATAAAGGSAPVVAGQPAPSIANSFEKFLSGTGDFMNKYKGPMEMLARGVGSAMKSKENEKAAQKLSDNRMAEITKNYELRANELATADQLKQNAQGRYSDSVKGLRTGGLINSGKLMRKDGTQVYGNNGLINRG
jgi:hypothetical protein